MKKLSLLIVAIFISLSSFSQKVDVKYFDRNGNVTNPEYAKYKELTSTKDNGIIETTYYKIKGDILIRKNQMMDMK